MPKNRYTLRTEKWVEPVRECGRWQGSEVTQQRSPSSQERGTEEGSKYKGDIVGCWDHCAEDGHNSLLSMKPPNPRLHMHSHFKNMTVLAKSVHDEKKERTEDQHRNLVHSAASYS